MRFGIDVLKVARIETSIDGQRRRHHKILPVVNADANTVSVTALHDTTGTDLLIETNATLAVGEHIEFHLPDKTYRTAAIVWTDGRLAGCRFTEPTDADTVENMVPLPEREFMHRQVNAELTRDASETLPITLRIAIIVGLSLLLWLLIGAVTLSVWS